jgi:hypothetical protein
LALGSITVLSQADAAIKPARAADVVRRGLPPVRPAASALGKSGTVRMRTAMPAARVDVPLELGGTPEGVSYEWVGHHSMVPITESRPLIGAIYAPNDPGFYRLVLTANGERLTLPEVVLGVMKPMAEKQGSSINGYRLGFWRGERRRDRELPAGLLEVYASDVDLPVSEHLTIGDFLTHDDQTSWPRYVALDPRLLDKLELVFGEIAARRGFKADQFVDVSVRSGFRTPLHNRRVPRAASDSRHQFGDAADIAVDADGDGRLSSRDVALIIRAVEAVERKHPDLLGGLGVYADGALYVHVDARGRRVRWRG